MKDTVEVIALLTVYLVLTQWLLPKLGVPT
jgi:hypothetical protein